MIFTKDEVALIRSNKKTAHLIQANTRIKAGRTTPLRRRAPRTDSDGNPTGEWITSTVTEPTDNEPKPVVLTILTATETITNDNGTKRPFTIHDLTQDHAEHCGYKTLNALLDAWRQKHPKTDHVKLITFTVGDIRDRDLYLNRTNTGGDYTSNPQRALAGEDAPVLTQTQLAPLTKRAREQDRKRREDPIQKARDNIMRELEIIDEQLRQHPNRSVANTVRALRHQLKSLDRRLKAA